MKTNDLPEEFIASGFFRTLYDGGLYEKRLSKHVLGLSDGRIRLY